MLKVAVTGGIGSGKSTICQTFRAMRVPVLSADELSKRIADTVPSVRKKIIRLLGPDSYGADGKLDRTFVAAAVFGHPRRLKRLEAILHPGVLRQVRAWFSDQKRKGKKVAVVEAALVYESGLDAFVDLVVVVDAAKTSRIERVRRRDGTSAASIRRRMDAQMPDSERRERADVVVWNDGSRVSLKKQAGFLIQVLRKLT